MKKLFLSAAIIFISTVAFAQFGITGGATVAQAKYKDKTGTLGSLTSKPKIGFTVGVFTEVLLSENFIFRPGLNYTQKGGKSTFTYVTRIDETTATSNYLELPLDFIYKATPGLFVGAGPSLAYGLSGKTKSTVTGSPIPGDNGTKEEKIKFGSDKTSDDSKAFEFGVNFLAGYHFTQNMFISVNYNIGVTNLSLTPDQESVRNTYFGIRLGYMLGGAGE
jgi:hypothetical protein